MKSQLSGSPEQWKARTIADLYKKRWDIELFLIGGKILIESEVNAGTKFTVTFKEKTINYNTEYEETALHGG